MTQETGTCVVCGRPEPGLTASSVQPLAELLIQQHDSFDYNENRNDAAEQAFRGLERLITVHFVAAVLLAKASSICGTCVTAASIHDGHEGFQPALFVQRVAADPEYRSRMRARSLERGP
jgi:hypothetical protein